MTLFSLSRFAVSQMTDKQVARIRQLEAGLSMIATKRAQRIRLVGHSLDTPEDDSPL